ncbi:MAG: cysteine desulfurase [Thermodesulfovibrionales bacterium]|nr:cysteine desulfurase [Thermodesulfovibrionales bacterium]
MIYLDYNATTPVDPRVQEAMINALKEFGNPSSSHLFGRRAKFIIDQARTNVAKLIGAKQGEIIFTSGGTESNNLAIIGTALRFGRGHIVSSSIEHPSVLNPLRYLESLGFTVTYLPVNPKGMVEPDDVVNAIRKDTILVTIMHANNETGVIQPISEIGKIVKEKGILFHTDAAQTIGKINTSVEELNVSMLTIASHKFYGPKGVGALYIRQGVEIKPILHGAGHEMGLRPGTENITGIAGLGKAAEIATAELPAWKSRIQNITEKLLDLLLSIEGINLNGHRNFRLPNTINISISGIEGDDLVSRLSDRVAISAGAACHAGKKKPSHVLKAMGLTDEQAISSVRITTGKDTSEDEIVQAFEIIKYEINRLRNS